MFKAAPLLFFLAAACGNAGGVPNRATAPEAAAAPPIAIPGAAAKPVAIDEETDLLEFHLAWPAEVSGIAALAAKLREAAMTHKAELLKIAAEDKESRARENFPFHAYEFGQDIEIEGDTPRLLSLSRSWYEFTGGAHPNHGTEGLLWDRQEGREVPFGEIFEAGPAKLETLLKPALCAALNKARAEKRGPDDSAAVVGPDDPFNQCPKLSELAFIPGGNPGHPMTKLTAHADPYIAGPYAEGDYDIELPVTDAMIAALKPDYRSYFATP